MGDKRTGKKKKKAKSETQEPTVPNTPIPIIPPRKTGTPPAK